MNSIDKLASEMVKTIQGSLDKKTSAYDTQAEVIRVDGNTAWVHIPGGVAETPVQMTTTAKKGDSVQVRVSGGQAWLTGNSTAPPTDDTTAIKAETKADNAYAVSEMAIKDAQRASEAAEQAETSANKAKTAATQAQNSLKSVVQGATTVEKAVSVMQTALEAVVDYDPQNDTVQEYFWHDANGAHVLGDTSGYRNDIDSTGMKVVDVGNEETISEFGVNGAIVGFRNNNHIFVKPTVIEFYISATSCQNF